MQAQAIKLVENNPALRKLMNESRGVTLAQLITALVKMAAESKRIIKLYD